MRNVPTTGGIIAVVLVVLLLLLAGWVELGLPYAGQKCNFTGDCDLNEVCRTIPFHQRDGSSYTGICVPRNW